MIAIEPIASGSNGNCYYITDGTTPLLLDCGVPLRRVRETIGFKTSGVAGCLLTHAHGDHSKATAEVMRAGIDIYTSQGTATALGLEGHRVRLVADKDDFYIGTWSGLAFKTEHDAPEPLGFLVASGGERLLYATDTYYVRYRFQGLNIVAIECNYADDILAANVANGSVPPALRDRLVRSHFSLKNVLGFLAANDLSQVREIHLLHLSAGNSDAERFAREVREATGKPVYVAGS